MKYILNFDYNKIKEINKQGMAEFEFKATKRKERADKASDIEMMKKIKAEKIDKLVLDTDDLLILRFIYTIGNEPKTVRWKDDNTYFWVKLNALLDEYDGLLFLTKTALNVRLNKYVAMKLIERKCVKNEDGSFSFIKLTGVNELVYVESKERKSVPTKKVPKDSNRNSPIENQIYIDEAEKVNKMQSKEIDEIIREATGADEEIVEKAIEYAIHKNAEKPIGFAIKAIKEDWDMRIVENKSNIVNPVGFNNFEPREYDYDKLERQLLGWE